MSKNIRREQILEDLRYLNENRHIAFNEVLKNSELYYVINRFKFFSINLKESHKEILKNLIIENISNDYEDNTVGSWLTGCIDKPPCDIVCLKSLNLNKNRWKICDINILNIKRVLNEYHIEILNNNKGKTNKVAIITTDNVFYGFNNKNIKWMKKNNFLQGSVIVKSSDQYRVIINFDDVEKLSNVKKNSNINKTLTGISVGAALGIVALFSIS